MSAGQHGLVCQGSFQVATAFIDDVHSLELNIHQHILSDLASNNNASPESTKHRKALIASKVQTRVADDEVEKGDDESTEENGTGRVYMVR